MTSLWHCDAPGRECYNDHWFSHLKEPVLKGQELGYGHRSIAPCHDDRERSLSTGVGENGLPVYWCFACNDQNLTRAKLIDAGIHPGCIKRSRKAQIDIGDAVDAIVNGDGSHAEKVLRVAALVAGRTSLPHGTELERIAAKCGVSRRSAYAMLGLEVKGADTIRTPGKIGPSSQQVRRPALAGNRCSHCTQVQPLHAIRASFSAAIAHGHTTQKDRYCLSSNRPSSLCRPPDRDQSMVTARSDSER